MEDSASVHRSLKSNLTFSVKIGTIRTDKFFERRTDMSIRAQAKHIGFPIIGELTRYPGLEPSHLYQYWFDDAENKYILYRGILTIVTADGRVF